MTISTNGPVHMANGPVHINGHMSIREWADTMPHVSGIEWKILSMIHTHHGHETPLPLTTIASCTGASKKTIVHAIQSLIKKGYLIRAKHGRSFTYVSTLNDHAMPTVSNGFPNGVDSTPMETDNGGNIPPVETVRETIPTQPTMMIALPCPTNDANPREWCYTITIADTNHTPQWHITIHMTPSVSNGFPNGVDSTPMETDNGVKTTPFMEPTTNITPTATPANGVISTPLETDNGVKTTPMETVQETIPASRHDANDHSLPTVSNGFLNGVKSTPQTNERCTFETDNGVKTTPLPRDAVDRGIYININHDHHLNLLKGDHTNDQHGLLNHQDSMNHDDHYNPQTKIKMNVGDLLYSRDHGKNQNGSMMTVLVSKENDCMQQTFEQDSNVDCGNRMNPVVQRDATGATMARAANAHPTARDGMAYKARPAVKRITNSNLTNPTEGDTIHGDGCDASSNETSERSMAMDATMGEMATTGNHVATMATSAHESTIMDAPARNRATTAEARPSQIVKRRVMRDERNEASSSSGDDSSTQSKSKTSSRRNRANDESKLPPQFFTLRNTIMSVCNLNAAMMTKKDWANVTDVAKKLMAGGATSEHVMAFREWWEEQPWTTTDTPMPYTILKFWGQFSSHYERMHQWSDENIQALMREAAYWSRKGDLERSQAIIRHIQALKIERDDYYARLEWEADRRARMR